MSVPAVAAPVKSDEVVGSRPAIEVSDLQKTYREGLFRRRTVEALRGVSFSVARGEIFGLLGPNGAGKTTLIKILLGIVRLSSGQASLLGHAPGSLASRRRVGYLPENNRIPSHHTGNSALEYFGGLSGLSPREVRRRRDSVLELVGLTGWGETNVRKYSKGMQQRLGIAQALLHEPELLILDEPTDGVDPVGRSEMRSLLLKLREAGVTIFLNSHHLQEIELICDRVVILDRGVALRQARVAELTVAAETVVLLRVQGDESAIKQAIGQREVVVWQPENAGNDAPQEYQLTIRVENQSDSDRLVDEMRTAGVSIVALARQRRTLEEAFLQTLTQGQQST
ncbi:MAG: ABC transporter ATP-binding protein [Planctomycetota bacterium]|nr:ABC transporter ATP-binding protein [Planctomycetota bacterium]